MNLPSRGARESVTTTRYRGRLLDPSRRSRIDTATSSPPESWKSRQILHPAQLAFHALELLHHLPQLRVLLEQPVDVLLFAVEVLGAGALEHLAEGQHAHDLVEGSHLAQLCELVAEVLQRERILAEL